MFSNEPKLFRKRDANAFFTQPSQIPIHLDSFLSHSPTYHCSRSPHLRRRLCRSLVLLYTDYHLIREAVLTYTLALVGDGDGVSSTTGGLTHVARAGVGALVDPADGARHLRRAASRAAHAVRRQVLVQQTVLAGRTTDPVARACGQLRRSAPYLHSTHSQTSTTLHLTSVRGKSLSRGCR